MPLFRRNSKSLSKENMQDSSSHQDAKPSFIKRLSSREKHQAVGEGKEQVRAASPLPSQAIPVISPTDLSRKNSSHESHNAQEHGKRDVIPHEETQVKAGEGLSKDDVKVLFFGAPHFMLEKGKHGKAFPQAFFPWNQDLEVSDLTDRKWLKHQSFALATLHAHLPIPDTMTWKPSSDAPKHEEIWKRPMFDLGIFECPNMLSVDGKEPGTVGMRYFLEIPLARENTSKADTIEQPSLSDYQITQLPAIEAMKALKNADGSAVIGKHAPHQDRLHLAQGGHRLWKQMGVRDIKITTLIDRFSTISTLHTQVLAEGFNASVLDQQSCQALHKQLFEEFLYPPEEIDHEVDTDGLKAQIEALVKVLTTPGAWIDFSHTEWRIRFGQVLWELPPHEGYESDTSSLPAGSERKWLLIQMLLAIELLVRLDAALRLGIARKSEIFHLSGKEIHHFNRLRNDKVNWDLVVARRFLDMLLIKPLGSPVTPGNGTTSPTTENGFFSAFKRKHESRKREEDASVWQYNILPRQVKIHVDGLLRFAQTIEWPAIDVLEEHFQSELLESRLPQEELFGPPVPSPISADYQVMAKKIGLRSEVKGAEWIRRACVILQPSKTSQLGGWLSRAWLTGMALPSEATSGLLIACLLENDAAAIKGLGRTMFLHGGFVLNGRSWWSIQCIVGRVFAPSKGTQCMGWINTPELIPVDVNSGADIAQGCYDIISEEVPSLRKGLRIHDGTRLAEESSPLGIGHGKVVGSEFIMITDGSTHGSLQQVTPAQVTLQAVKFARCKDTTAGPETYEASATFLVEAPNGEESFKQNMRLAYDAYFVTAHSCRRPYGHTHMTGKLEHGQHRHDQSELLSAHPLHQSYKYCVKSVLDLMKTTPPDPNKAETDVWIVDAMDETAKDIFVRAWCAQVGRHALVARTGRTCISCAIRQAKALQLGIIIRIGSKCQT